MLVGSDLLPQFGIPWRCCSCRKGTMPRNSHGAMPPIRRWQSRELVPQLQREKSRATAKPATLS